MDFKHSYLDATNALLCSIVTVLSQTEEKDTGYIEVW